MGKQRLPIPDPEPTEDRIHMMRLLESHFHNMPPGPFKPVASYRPELDQIEVIIRDCSVTHRRVNEIVAIMEDNYPDITEDVHVGFVVDCARAFCNRHGLIHDDQVSLPELTRALFGKNPETFAGIDEIHYWSQIVEKILSQVKVKVLRLV